MPRRVAPNPSVWKPDQSATFLGFEFRNALDPVNSNPSSAPTKSTAPNAGASTSTVSNCPELERTMPRESSAQPTRNLQTVRRRRVACTARPDSLEMLGAVARNVSAVIRARESSVPATCRVSCKKSPAWRIPVRRFPRARKHDR